MGLRREGRRPIDANPRKEKPPNRSYLVGLQLPPHSITGWVALGPYYA